MSIPVFKSAVAIIEAPSSNGAAGSFLLEQRPPKHNTDMCDPGLLQLIGGHLNPEEDEFRGLLRELNEETDLPVDKIRQVEEGVVSPDELACRSLGIVPWMGRRQKDGREIIKFFDASVFHIALLRGASFSLTPKETERGSSIVGVSAELGAVEAKKEDFAPFAYNALSSFVQGKPIEGNV